MAFFASGEDKNKLMVLYVLRMCNMPLSQEQLVTILADNGIENYFDASACLLDLEENGYIASVPTLTMQMEVLTKRGEELVSFFDKTLPKSLREALDEYVEQHISEFRMANTTRSELTPLSNGSVEAVFAIVEGGESIFEMKMVFPSVFAANNAQRNWESINDEIYIDVLRKLTKK